MIRSLAVSVAALLIWEAYAQPPGCTMDAHCSDGFYCVPEVHFCQPCLSCKTFKREPPAKYTSCVTSFTDCGNCLKGLVQDVAGDLCISPGERESESPPWYMWLLIACIPLLVVIGIFVMYKLLRKRRIAQSLNFISSASGEKTQAPAPASAPPEHMPPPPYGYSSTPYNYTNPLPPSSYPDNQQARNGYPPKIYTEESEQPLVQRHPKGGPDPSSTQRDSNQATRPFNPPYYIRNSQFDEEYNDDHVNDQAPEEHDEPMPFEPHNEETMPSSWVPNNEVNGNNEEASSVNGEHNTLAAAEEGHTGADAGGSRPFAMLRRPSRSDLSPPPPKMIRGDSNNNRNNETGENGSGSGSGGPGNAGSAGGPNVTIHINATNVCSYKNVSLRSSHFSS